MRYKGAVQSVREIARNLDAGSVLEGSLRRCGDHIRVSVQLIDGSSEDHVWAEEYDSSQSDLLLTQRSIAEEVARALSLRLLPDEEERMPSLPTCSLEAHLLYVQGFRHLVRHTETDFQQAITSFEEALSIDPTIARAHAKIAHAWMLLSRSSLSLDSVESRVERALERALTSDPQEAEAHAINGLFQWAFKRDSVEAEAAIRRAIRLNPSNVEAHECMRDLMGTIGRYNEGLAAAKEALVLSSGLDPGLHCGVGRMLIGMGRLNKAFEVLEEARMIDPEHAKVLDGLASAEEAIWQWDKAEAYRTRLRELISHSVYLNRGLVLHMLARGRFDEALELVHSFPRDRSNEVYLGYLEGWSLMLARRYREAIEVFANAVAGHRLVLPHTGWQLINQLRAIAHSEIGEHAEALQHFEASYEESSQFGVRWTPVICETGMALVKAHMGDEAAVPRLLRRFLGQVDEMRIPTLLSVLYFSSGSLDEGFKWLSVAIDRPAHWPLSHLKVHPWFDPARGDRRFLKALRRVNLEV